MPPGFAPRARVLCGNARSHAPMPEEFAQEVARHRCGAWVRRRKPVVVQM